MRLIVGLGNPGDQYTDSRHNIGFAVVEAFSKEHDGSFKRDRGTFSLTAKVSAAGEDIILARPVTFMNLSGTAVKALLKKYRIAPDNLLVVCDDLDLAFGRLRIRPGGSSAGHRGIDSIIDHLHRNDFSRLRIGIGRPPEHMEASDFVLTRFSRREKQEIAEAINRACACCESWITQDIEETMNQFNKRSRE